jgi:hypothetical protein
LVLELNMHPSAGLADKPDFLDEQIVIRGSNPEAANLGISRITQEQQLGPGRGAEAQQGLLGGDRRATLEVHLHGNWHTFRFH